MAREGVLPVIIRAGALAHLRAIVERAATPEPDALFEEFVTKQDFLAWLDAAGLPSPAFWFGREVRREG